MVSTDNGGSAAGRGVPDADMQAAIDFLTTQKAQQAAAGRDRQPCGSAACSSAPGSHQSLHHSPMHESAADVAASSCCDSDESDVQDMVQDDGSMSDADSGDSDLTARITGLEVRLARRSAEVEMLKAAVAACQADAETPSPPATPQPPLRPVPRRAVPDPMPRLLSADSAGQFVVSLDGRVVLSSGPYAGKPLSQVAQHDRQYLREYLWAPPQAPAGQSQLLAALALRNALPVRCR